MHYKDVKGKAAFAITCLTPQKRGIQHLRSASRSSPSAKKGYIPYKGGPLCPLAPMFIAVVTTMEQATS